MIRRVCGHATYANVMASIAVFIAIGGTSYAAISLPRNSVGERQLKNRAVGTREIRSGAVGSRAIRDGAVKVADLAGSTRQRLAGTPGPPGPAGAPAVQLRTSVSSTGSLHGGNATSLETNGVGNRVIGFPRGLDGCVPVATLAKDLGTGSGSTGPGHIVVSLQGDRVAVDTYGAAGNPTYLPFNLIVTC